jgi:hypothetical protein
MLQLGEEVPQVGIDLEGEGVEALGSGERDRPHPLVDLESEVIPSWSETG